MTTDNLTGASSGERTDTAVAAPTREQRLYDALKRISKYQMPDKLRRTSEKEYGLCPEEAIAYAYENVIGEAQAAIKGMRRPK